MTVSPTWLVLHILGVCSLGWLATVSLAVAPHAPPPTTRVADWVRTKCCGKRQQLWKYQGALYDPLDGRRIAQVEGVEWVTLLRQNETSNLIISQVLQKHNPNNATWQTAATLWSKHVFCYTTTAGDDDDDDDNGNNDGDNDGDNDNDNDNGIDGSTKKKQTRLLRDIRIRPYSPEKRIPLDQAAAAYETCTTWIERPSGEVLVHSEWPLFGKKKSNQTVHVWGTATPTQPKMDADGGGQQQQQQQQQQQGTFGFSVFAKRRSPKSPLYLPDLTPKAEVTTSGKSSHHHNSSSSSRTSMVVSPKRSSFIQFGLSNMETQHKFGARETYTMTVPPHSTTAESQRRRRWFPPWSRWFGTTITTGNKGDTSPPPRLTYTRYGEGPPFFAPGRMCMLELQAEPIDSIQDASPVVQRLLQTQVQGWNIPTTSGSSSIGSRAIPMMGNGDALHLLPEEGVEPVDVWTRYKGHTLALWERTRKVTNVVSLIRKEKRFW